MNLRTIAVVGLLSTAASIPVSLLTGALTAKLIAPPRHALECEFDTTDESNPPPREQTEAKFSRQTVYLEFLPDSKILVGFVRPDRIATALGAVEVTNINYTISLGMVFYIDRQTGVLTGHNPTEHNDLKAYFNGACHAVAVRTPKL